MQSTCCLSNSAIGESRRDKNGGFIRLLHFLFFFFSFLDIFSLLSRMYTNIDGLHSFTSV